MKTELQIRKRIIEVKKLIKGARRDNRVNPCRLREDIITILQGQLSELKWVME